MIYVCATEEANIPKSSLYVRLCLNEEEAFSSFKYISQWKWVWKNALESIVGLCYENHFFEYNHDFLDENSIKGLMEEYDVILPYTKEVTEGTLLEYYGKQYSEDDILIVESLIKQKEPEYEQAFKYCINFNLYSPVGMIVAKKKVFKELCEWIFPIIELVEKYIMCKEGVPFVFALLIRMWLLMHTYSVYEMSTIEMDPINAYNNRLVLEKKTRLLELSIYDLLILYKNGNPVDIFEDHPKVLNYERQIPVWICWWQGFEDAPELVRICRKSIYEHMTPDIFQIIEITLDNVNEYVHFPDWIVEKFERGIISMTQLSDMLRMALLYYYGGVWMDATYFVAHPIRREHILNTEKFYSLHLEHLPWKTDVCDGLWAEHFLKYEKGALLPRFVLNGFYYYYAKNNENLDYFMADYLIKIAYLNFSEIKEEIDALPLVDDFSYRFVEYLNEPYDEESVCSMLEHADFYKLTYKKEFYKKDLLERETIYGYLSRRYGDEF